jgi:predicted enzyme related to lactoylglutathione lyase
MMRAVQITIDCTDPQSLAPWWAETLQGKVAYDLGDYVAVSAPGSNLPGLLFQRVPEQKVTKNRVHVDFEVDDPDEQVAALLARGATLVGHRTQYGIKWVTLQDPVGNEFCVHE